MRLPLLVTIVFLTGVSAIFEDQAGKFDWRKPLIGCPARVEFDKVGSNSDRLLVSTEQSILASLVLNTGNIGWRKIMEDSEHTPNGQTFAKDREYIYSLSSDGRSLRVWLKNNAVMARQMVISEEKSSIQAIHVTNNRLYVASGKTLMAFRLGEEKPSETIVAKRERTFSAFFQKDDALLHVSAYPGDSTLEVMKIGDDGSFESPPNQLNFEGFDVEKCHHQSQYISCLKGAQLLVVDVFNPSKIHKLQLDSPQFQSISGSRRLILVRAPEKLHVIELTPESGLQVRKSIDVTSSDAVAVPENDESIVIVSSESVRIVSVNSQKHFEAKRVKSDEKKILENSGARRIFARKSEKDWEIVLVGEDCRIEFVTVDEGSKLVNLEWAREESLINTVSVEMVDLPLSESQQMIEDEFEEEGNIFYAFARRITTQFGQFCRGITRNVEKVIQVITSISRDGNGVSDFINSVRAAGQIGSASSSGPFERDYFNLRKVIIVVTSTGTIFGIDSADGQFLWKMWLGTRFSPLESELESKRVPLFVQRTTAHYQLDGLASVVFMNKITGNAVIVSFNPMIGKVESRNELGYSVKRLSILPVLTQKHVHPVMLIGKNNEIKTFPSISPEELTTATSSLYILDIQESSAAVQGLKIDLSTQKIETVWQGNLGLTPDDEIVAIKGKSFYQKVHSQGRVLETREVQYKYINPNLAAIASINKADQHLTITLVDIVTGQIVHSAAIGKSAKPIHLVHSENWIAYTYWSEKGRRTELGIIELFEGTEDKHTQKLFQDTFDSKIAPKLPPVVAQQSYIYAQGVDAMSVSETEQGLTTRSILLAHPSGNIHEVSRRLLDANRPMELTQAMREEMMIGYMPEIAVATEEMINYNQTVHRVRGIKTSPSGLESTSLVLAYGTDLFFTRLVPSGTFDILKDDFDHVLISLVLTGLVVGSYVTKRLARSNALASQWS